MRKNPLTNVLIQRLSNLSIKKQNELGLPLVTIRDYSKLSLSISKALNLFGFPKDHPGTEYLKYTIILALTEPELLDNYMSKLYPIVAKRYNVIPSSVEKAIRNSSKKMCTRADTLNLRKEWFYTTKRPSNNTAVNVLIKYILSEE